MTERPRILRAPTGLFWLVGVAAVAVLLLGDVVVRGGGEQALLIAPWLLVPVWFVYVFFYAPHVAVDARRVRVHNVLRAVELPWAAVDDIVMRWQLEFHLTEAARAANPAAGGRKGVVLAWSFTRRGRGRAAARVAEETDDTLDVLRGLRASAEPQPDARPTVSWDIPAIVTGVVIAAWCVVALVVTR
ncbi:hypothetical protein [Microbacterium sp. NPDC096154]|uniref:hypothetical protein n=1 Tax=Microbacterium sp. NPDC096154 TaxID=3155549 RepID=UPI00331ABC42